MQLLLLALCKESSSLDARSTSTVYHVVLETKKGSFDAFQVMYGQIGYVQFFWVFTYCLAHSCQYMYCLNDCDLATTIFSDSEHIAIFLSFYCSMSPHLHLLDRKEWSWGVPWFSDFLIFLLLNIGNSVNLFFFSSSCCAVLMSRGKAHVLDITCRFEVGSQCCFVVIVWL